MRIRERCQSATVNKFGTNVGSPRKVRARNVNISWLEIQGVSGSRTSRDARYRLELTVQLVRVISHITPRDSAGTVGVII